MLRGGGDAGGIKLFLDHVRRTGKEPVAVRVVGRPQDLVRADIVGEMREAALDRLERNPALAAEDVARARFEAAVVEALVIEMAVHAVEPRCDPAAARFEEADAQLRMPLADATPDYAEAGEHHLHRVADDVLRGAALEAIDADRRHARRAALVEADDKIVFLASGPE